MKNKISETARFIASSFAIGLFLSSPAAQAAKADAGWPERSMWKNIDQRMTYRAFTWHQRSSMGR